MEVIDLANKEVESVFALIYGESGTGKTHLCGTVGALGRVLIVDIDKGIKTLKYAPDLQKGILNTVVVVSFDSFKDLNEMYKLVQKNDPAEWSRKLNTDIKEPFDWIIYDTWSELQWTMKEQLRVEKGISSTDLKFRKNLEIQHWGALTDLNKLCVESLRDCKVNQIFTMQESLMKDEVTGVIYGGPAIHGKLVQEFPAYFDTVIRTYSNPAGIHCATTLAKGRWPAKTRLGVGKEYKEPTAAEIFKGI